MAGVRDSEKRNLSKKSKEQISFESVEAKYRKENMSVEEFAMLICKRRGLVPGGITGKTVKNYLAAICEMSEGLLSLKDFRAKPDYEKSKFVFKPQNHAMLLTLMASDYFDGRKNDRRIGTRAELYGQLVDNINQYLEETDKKVIKQNPTYYNAQLEQHLTRHLTDQLASILREVYHSDPVLRYQFMIELISDFKRMNDWMAREDAKAMSTRMVYAHTLDELNDAKYQKGVFEATELDKFLVKYLALNMHGEKYCYVSDSEELSYPATLLACELFNITIKNDSDLEKIKKQIDAVIENDEKYKGIVSKAEQVFDSSVFEENRILNIIKELARIEYLRPIVSADEYEKTIRFTEDCIKQDKWDILNVFLNIGRRGMTEDEIEKIMDIKDKKY